MTITQLVTHSGGFHADEVLSTAILSRLYPQAGLLRTRDARHLIPASNKIIYDVGREYDAGKQIFDHHQSPKPLRKEGQPFSSFGLIWKHFGHAYLAALQLPQEHIESIHSTFDRTYVLPIDLLDNGEIEPSLSGSLASLSFPEVIHNLRPVFDQSSGAAEDNAFKRALEIARSFIEGVLQNTAAKYRARATVFAAIEKAGRGAVLELPMGMPYREALEEAGADHILFVIHPREKDWTLNAIKLSANTFEQRADLPQAWAGLTDEALEQASGVKGARFCHNARFLAVAGSREAILKMAQIAVKQAGGE